MVLSIKNFSKRFSRVIYRMVPKYRVPIDKKEVWRILQTIFNFIGLSRLGRKSTENLYRSFSTCEITTTGVEKICCFGEVNSTEGARSKKSNQMEASRLTNCKKVNVTQRAARQIFMVFNPSRSVHFRKLY